jgi:hypothetical protein
MVRAIVAEALPLPTFHGDWNNRASVSRCSQFRALWDWSLGRGAPPTIESEQLAQEGQRGHHDRLVGREAIHELEGKVARRLEVTRRPLSGPGMGAHIYLWSRPFDDCIDFGTTGFPRTLLPKRTPPGMEARGREVPLHLLSAEGWGFIP